MELFLHLGLVPFPVYYLFIYLFLNGHEVLKLVNYFVFFPMLS